MKKILIIILLSLLNFMGFSQTIIKTADASYAYPGQIVTYTFRIKNLPAGNMFGWMAGFRDALDPATTFISASFNGSNNLENVINGLRQFNPSLPAYTPQISAPGNVLQFSSLPDAAYNNSGMTISELRFSVKVLVNAQSCSNNVSKIENQASLSPTILSNKTTFPVLHRLPYRLTKTFLRYDALTSTIYYSIRFTRNSGEIDPSFLGIGNFTDQVFLPDGYAISNPDNITITRDNQPVQIANGHRTQSTYIFEWKEPALGELRFAEYVVGIPVTCIGVPSPSNNILKNVVRLNATTFCPGINLNLTASYELPMRECRSGQSNPGGPADTIFVDPQPAEEIIDSICVTKSVKMDNNDWNIAMRGCAGVYTITASNCFNSQNVNLRNVVIRDAIPTGLTVLFPYNLRYKVGTTYYTTGIVYTSANNTINITLPPNLILDFNNWLKMEIPVMVSDAAPYGSLLTNCVDVTATAFTPNSTTPPATVRETRCSAPISMVEEDVVLHVGKYICTLPPTRTCGSFTTTGYLPGDIVKYRFIIYNTGLHAMTNGVLTDQLPTVLENIQTSVYSTTFTTESGLGTCGTTFTPAPMEAQVNLNSATNLLTISNINLPQFSCNGVKAYVIYVTGRIRNGAANGSYFEPFALNGIDKITNQQVGEFSNEAGFSVNTDQVIMYYTDNKITSTDCQRKTIKIKRTIAIANTGNYPVSLTINTTTGLPSGIQQIGAAIQNYQECTTNQPVMCNPTTAPAPATPTFTFTLTSCVTKVISWEQTFNIDNLSPNASGNICFDVNIRGEYLNVPASTPNLIILPAGTHTAAYMKLKSAKERSEFLKIIYQQENVKVKTPTGNAKVNSAGTRNIVATSCISVRGCPRQPENTCISCEKYPGTTPISLTYSGVNTQTGTANFNVDIPATMNNFMGVSVMLSDIRFTKTCKPVVTTLPNNWQSSTLCNHCEMKPYSNNTTITTPAGWPALTPMFESDMHHQRFQNYSFGNRWSTQRGLSSGNISFNLPFQSLNCDGQIEGVLTLQFLRNDCSVCFVSVPFLYNANFQLPRGGGIGRRP